MKQHQHTHAHKHAGHAKKHAKKHGGKKPHHPSPHPKAAKGPAVTPGPLVVPVPGQQHHKKRGMALGGAVPCCSVEALAASLRLAGWPVGDGDVLALHVAAGGSQDVGVPILAALEAAVRVGLAGVRPSGFEEVARSHLPRPVEGAARAQLTFAGEPMLLLGAELPGPHALTVDGPGVWSWGEWHPWSCFGDAVIEETWAVTWAPEGGV